ncbi:MAG TPA: YebC/PmpR family DNA-binding transcriptional regulator [Steroidobacteraceae bacterium]|nr:YebC/PmpR family DNA-binding transcriptional regulator [Steroidobacteraceae bacterium]
MASHTKWANIQHVTGRAARAVRARAEPGGACASPPVRYEGYGPGVAAVLIECITDDRNRTRADLRRAFSEHGGHLGAEDVVPNSDHSIEVLADPMEFETVRALLTDHGFVPAAAEVTERASLTTPLSGEPAERMVRLLETLEDLDDVRNVYSNVEISDEVLARI